MENSDNPSHDIPPAGGPIASRGQPSQLQPSAASPAQSPTTGNEHPAVGVSRVVAPTAGAVALAVLGLITGPEALALLAGVAGLHAIGSVISRLTSQKLPR